MRKGILALVGMILALVFIIVALVGPWYGFSFKMTQEGVTGEMNANMYLTRGEMRLVYPGTDTTQSDNYESDMEGKSAFDGAMYLTIITLIMAILTLIAIFGATFNFGKAGAMRKLGMIFGIITFILAIVAVLYFMISWGGAIKDSDIGGSIAGSTGGLVSVDNLGFFYSKSDSLWNFSMGPGFAWYLMLVTSIIALVSSIFIFMDRPRMPVYQSQPAAPVQ